MKGYFLAHPLLSVSVKTLQVLLLWCRVTRTRQAATLPACLPPHEGGIGFSVSPACLNAWPETP